MRLAVMLEPQLGLSYGDQLAVARAAQRLGFDALFRSDHYGSDTGGAEPGSTDAWAVLAGLARETDAVGLGVLVSPVTFRRAGNLAKVAATVAAMAGSRGTAPRIELGMGTGWMESEHRAHGFPFEDVDTRFRRLEEHLRVVRGLWDPAQEPFSFRGEFEHLEDACFAPRPDPPPRLLVGGKGPRRTPLLAARYADEWNTMLAPPERCAELRAVLDAASAEARREPIPLSLMAPAVVGRTRDEVRQRAARLLERLGTGRTPDDHLARIVEVGVAGTPDDAVERLGAYAEAGVDRVMLQHLLVDDERMLELVAQAVLPRVTPGS
jgi:alkanesulfonate monooxygenase SsuD/methylene tetrahydromethanopterin reductase-like flavin-dependent oxidoreductase (luciferase family)